MPITVKKYPFKPLEHSQSILREYVAPIMHLNKGGNAKNNLGLLQVVASPILNPGKQGLQV